jgi:hypothetical protein
VPDEITTRILYAAAARVAADLAADGLDQAALDDLELGARMAAAVDDAPLARPVRAIVDRALGGRAMAVAA